MKWKNVFPLPIVAALIVAASSLVGVLIGVDHSSKNIITTIKAQEDLGRIRQKEQVEAVLQAIYEELSVINKIFQPTDSMDSWRAYEEEKTFYKEIFPISQDYLLIYTSNVNLVGKIENAELRRKIVHTYAALQSCINVYMINNKFLDLYIETKSNDEESKLPDELDHLLRDIAPKLKRAHDISKQFVKELLKILEKELSQPNNQSAADDNT